MRWIFLFVLFLNLAYIAWEVNRPSVESYSGVLALKNVQSIVLLSELNQVQKTALNESGNVAQTVSLHGSDEPAGSVPEKDRPTGNKSLEVESLAVEPAVPATSTLALNAQDSLQAEKGDNEAEAVLLSSSPARNRQKTIVDEKCYTMGPFRDLEVLRSLMREIKAYVVATDFHGREVKEQSLYWVYIKPEKNRKAAIATGKRLKAKKIKDFYVIREGEQIHGVSLGYFRNKNGAQGLVSKVKKLGFDVVLEPVFKTYTVYWLDYRMNGDVEIPQTIIDKYLQVAEKDKITRLDRLCAL